MTVLSANAFPPRLRAWRLTDPDLAIGLGSGLVMVTGLGLGQSAMVGAGAVGAAMACRNWLDRRTRQVSDLALRSGPVDPQPEPAAPAGVELPRSPTNESDLVAEMLATSRYALLLRPETASQLTRSQHQSVIQALDDNMVLTPAGNVLVGAAAERETLGSEAAGAMLAPGAEGRRAVASSYLDRYPVTNRQYQQFVDSGGYEAMNFWPEEALPALFDFVDQTGAAAPRGWRDGRYAVGEENLPVVGISWYEAVAYARWVGKRLPTDAEWTKACAWPIESAPGRIAQRRYPWGEAFDTRKANLWTAGHGRPVEVDAYPQGRTVGGVEQMVGNVWEWTASTLDETTPQAVRFPSALRTVRGGAFNTYFENQATCHFQSAEHPLARRDNIGLRLAISMDTLAPLTASAAERT